MTLPGGILSSLCVGYCALNQVTVNNKHPLPRIDDLLDRLSGAHVLSLLDLQPGDHQECIIVEDVPKTAFRMHQGLFDFRILSSGLTNAPAVFQCEMNTVLAHHDSKTGRRSCYVRWTGLPPEDNEW